MIPSQSDPQTAAAFSEADLDEELAISVPVDWNALAVGDTLILRVKELQPNYGEPSHFNRHWHVISYIPTPRVAKAGDRVRLGGGSVDGQVICVDGDYAWVRWTDPSGAVYRGVHPVDRLQRVAS